jgi:hypothetical protein
LKKIIDNKPLLIILLSGFVLKLLYLFVIGPAVFQNWTLTTQDSHSYTRTFINLVNTGNYTHDPKFLEASYGRLPVVVFLWGAFYLLLGEAKAYIGYAIFQILLDVVATYFIYKIFSKLFYEKMGLIVSFFHAFFPLTIYFVVKTDTEYLALFIVISVFYKLVHFKNDIKNSLSLVLLLAVGFYVRETLILLIPISFFYLWRNFDLGVKRYFFMALLFMIFYLPWPVRNYMLSDKIVVIKPLSAGYADYQKDMLGYMYWLYAWNSDQPDDYLAYAYKPEREIKFPEEVFANETEKQLATNTIRLAQRCGTSFIEWQRDQGIKTKCYGCYDDLIARSFALLKNNYKRDHPFNYYIKVPLQNSAKAFFKSSLTISGSAPETIFKIVMWMRSLLIFIGLGACFYYRKMEFFKITFIYFAVKYIFIVAVLRQVEMRYLFQSDVMIILAATAFIADKFFNKKLKENI